MAYTANKVILSLKLDMDLDAYQFQKMRILNYIFRHVSFVDHRDNIIALSKEELKEIVSDLNISNKVLLPIITQFFLNTLNFKRFFESTKISWEHNLDRLIKKVRIYLHKIHRIAPVFSYERAKENLKILHSLFERRNHWPHFSTQIALIIFITDRNDKAIQEGEYIIQKNLRVLCNCSAYAFHHARNLLRINKNGQIF